MSVLENFLANQDKVRYTSYFRADKIAVYSTQTESSGIGIRGTLYVYAGNPVSSQVSVATIANPYGTKLLPTMTWSLDGTNFYSANTPIFYYNATYMTFAWQCIGFMGCSDDLIYIGATSQYESDQLMYVNFALDSIT